MCYKEEGLSEDKYKVSLRSIGKEDTTIISAQFGGGGHLNASGFTISKKDFESWIAK